MAVVTCPKCPTKLKVPDGVSGNTRCPKCGAVFPIKPAPAFEVVDGAPPPAAAPKPGARPVMKTAAPEPADEEPDFEVVEETPGRRARIDDDDDDEKPRKKRKVDEDDDDDDEPRAKKKKKRYDDDDDDRPRKKKKKKRYEDDEDDEDWRPAHRSGSVFARGKTGALLLAISFWLNLGSYGLLALYALIAWIAVNLSSSSSSSGGGSSGDGSFMDIIVVLPGLIGLGNWIVGIVGLSFCIAGPRQAKGMAITATVLAGVHLLLVGVTFSNMQGGLGGMGRGFGMGKPAWVLVATTLPFLDALFPLLFYASRAVSEGDYVIGLLAAVCEVLRLIFALLTLQAMAAAARDPDAGAKAQSGVAATLIVVGGAALGVLLMTVLLAEGGFKSLKTVANIGVLTMLLVSLAYTFMMLGPAVAAMQTKDACDRRS